VTSPAVGEPTLQERLLYGTAAALGPSLIRLLGALCRYRVVGEDRLEAAQALGKGTIIALWHGRMLLPVFHLRRRGICALVSLHRDGELIARIVQRLGYVTRRGSPKEGGREGFLAMLHDLRAGSIVAIFPDGPTGPRHSVRDGVVHLARLSGAPVVPISFSSNPSWRAGSWDRFMIMKPFSRGVLLFGEPFVIERHSDRAQLERQRDLIREKLLEVEREADRMAGLEQEQG